MVDWVQERPACHDSNTVASTRIVKRLAKFCMHAQQSLKLCELILSTRPISAPIHLLKRNDVRLDALYHFSETPQIKPAIGAFAMMDVVGQHTNPDGIAVVSACPDQQHQQEHREYCGEEFQTPSRPRRKVSGTPR